MANFFLVAQLRSSAFDFDIKTSSPNKKVAQRGKKHQISCDGPENRKIRVLCQIMENREHRKTLLSTAQILTLDQNFFVSCKHKKALKVNNKSRKQREVSLR